MAEYLEACLEEAGDDPAFSLEFEETIMSVLLDELAEASLKLDLEERAELAERLLRSLDEPTSAEVERLWETEAIRRLEAYRKGETQAISAEEVFRRAQADLA
jgi:putative addiction module component (TIGR02574 family)